MLQKSLGCPKDFRPPTLQFCVFTLLSRKRNPTMHYKQEHFTMGVTCGAAQRVTTALGLGGRSFFLFVHLHPKSVRGNGIIHRDLPPGFLPAFECFMMFFWPGVWYGNAPSIGEGGIGLEGWGGSPSSTEVGFGGCNLAHCAHSAEGQNERL